ncbi:MAG: hypothetical protein K9L30_00055 [Desulfobacterales bacterium]|nr:hypothetical protein [Desulfobacterales bacterium]
MSDKSDAGTLEKLMAEADALIQQIDSFAIDDINEEDLKKIENHAQNLKKIKAEAQNNAENKNELEISTVADGMHEAIQSIVKAMEGLKNNPH